MLESLLLVQGKIVPPPEKGDITFKTSGTSATTITVSGLGTGFKTQYSVDGSPLTLVGTNFSIPAGNHEVTLKLDVTTGTSLDMTQFAAILTEVTDWEGFQLSNIQFNGCANLSKVPGQLPETITSMSRMFYNCASFNQDISDWDTSQVTDMSTMFYGCTSFSQDIGGWDVSKVTNMTRMFNNCISFNQDISRWDVRNVTDMTRMFNGCTSFNQDLSSMVFKSTVIRANYDNGASAWNSAYRPKFTG